MPLIADTTFLIDLSRDVAAARAMLDAIVTEGQTLVVPTIVMAEFLAGSTDPPAAAARLREAAEILDFTQEDALAAAAVAAEAFDAGRFPGWSDVFIAGVARNRGHMEIVTRNARHFPGSRTRQY